ncbi:zinc-finger domain-containing protein [Roseomonas elaeocarpi]|uniref:Zinc-finger domain-containing protein n=1 Tax=Roseomonas elaeocarpi TaxID=907779 RepID=A0ABV6JNU2_9PROT
MRDGHFTGYTPEVIPGVTPQDRITVSSRVVACDGGRGVAGHPAIYIRIEGQEATCPYCSRTFVLAEGAGHEDH